VVGKGWKKFVLRYGLLETKRVLEGVFIVQLCFVAKGAGRMLCFGVSCFFVLRAGEGIRGGFRGNTCGHYKRPFHGIALKRSRLHKHTLESTNASMIAFGYANACVRCCPKYVACFHILLDICCMSY